MVSNDTGPGLGQPRKITKCGHQNIRIGMDPYMDPYMELNQIMLMEMVIIFHNDLRHILSLEYCAAMGDWASKISSDISFKDGTIFAPGWYDRSCHVPMEFLCEKSCEDCTLDHGKFDQVTFIA